MYLEARRRKREGIASVIVNRDCTFQLICTFHSSTSAGNLRGFQTNFKTYLSCPSLSLVTGDPCVIFKEHVQLLLCELGSSSRWTWLSISKDVKSIPKVKTKGLSDLTQSQLSWLKGGTNRSRCHSTCYWGKVSTFSKFDIQAMVSTGIGARWVPETLNMV